MYLQNQHYAVTTTVETMPPLSQFDIVHELEPEKTKDFYMARVLKIEPCGGPSGTVALTDLLCASYEPHRVLEGDRLTLIFYDCIVRLDLGTGLILERRDCGSWGELGEIHPIPDGYIIWGECDLFRYDLQLNRVWHFMGRDMLVSLKGDRSFWIEDGLIHCRDFLGWQYMLDLDGKLIRDFREFEDSEDPQDA